MAIDKYGNAKYTVENANIANHEVIRIQMEADMKYAILTAILTLGLVGCQADDLTLNLDGKSYNCSANQKTRTANCVSLDPDSSDFEGGGIVPIDWNKDHSAVDKLDLKQNLTDMSLDYIAEDNRFEITAPEFESLPNSTFEYEGIMKYQVSEENLEVANSQCNGSYCEGKIVMFVDFGNNEVVDLFGTNGDQRIISFVHSNSNGIDTSDRVTINASDGTFTGKITDVMSEQYEDLRIDGKFHGKGQQASALFNNDRLKGGFIASGKYSPFAMQ